MILQANISQRFKDINPVSTQRNKPIDYLAIWSLAGRSVVEVPSGREDFGPGTLVVLEPGVPQHYWTQTERFDWLWVHFEGSAARGFFEALRPAGRLAVKLGFEAAIYDRFLELLTLSPSLISSPTTSAAKGAADACLVSLLGMMAYRVSRTTADANRAEPFDIRVVTTLIDEHLHEAITVDQLARAAQLSPAHFSRRFREWFGQSPMQYVINRRIDRAAALLRSTDLKLAAVAAAVGYDDPFYFSRQFKHVAGQSPSAYRQTQAASDEKTQK